MFKKNTKMNTVHIITPFCIKTTIEFWKITHMGAFDI